MPASATYRQRRIARDPVVIELDDGVELRFPGDLNAGKWLDFLNEHGDDLDGLTVDDIPLHLQAAWYRLVLSDDGFDQCIAAGLSVTELGAIAGRVWLHYQALHAVAVAASNGGDSGKPGGPGSAGLSKNGQPSEPTSSNITGSATPTT